MSPTANGAGVNPPIGVTKVQVTIPVVVVFDIPTTLDTDTPLELLIVLILCSTDFKPLGELFISTDEIELDVKVTSITPWSVNFPVSGSTTTISGAVRYSAPPDITSILLIESELIKVIVGDILASGFRVLSEWYSKPGSNIRTLLILLILVDKQRIFELIPLAEVTLVIPGIFLYPNPPDAKLILDTPPDAVKELVE